MSNAKNETMELEQYKPGGAIAAPTPIDILRTVVSGGVTNDNVAVIEKMADLCERFEKRNAEKAFTSAFVALQSDLPTIVASSVIPNRGKYERYEDIMKVVNPLLQKHGFTVSFSMDYAETRIVVKCHLKHVEGHSETNSFAVRVGGRADSETQADCKAATTAKRNALLQALNIIIRQDALMSDDDASNIGDCITFEDAVKLRERAEACGADLNAFLKFAGAKTFESIGRARYADCCQMLDRKEAKAKR
jgi:hypothetical protein